MPVRRTRRSQRFLRVCVLALLLASGLAACNGSTDDEPPPAATETAPSTAVPAAEPAPAMPVPAAETPPPPATPPDAPIPEPPAEPATPGEPSPPAAASPAPAPAPVPRSFRYDTYDLSGAVAEPEHYVFLTDPADPASVVTTYEELRDGTATALRIHTHDTHGVSQAAFYANVATGDLVEWKRADDCFVRYTVTSAPTPAAGAVTRAFSVAWMTYAFTGCSGAIAGDTAVTFEWGDLPDLGGPSLTAPIVHGIYQIVPEDWIGVTEAGQLHHPPGATPGPFMGGQLTQTDDLTVARTHTYWREPSLPADWTFAFAVTGGYETSPIGYCAAYSNAHGFGAVTICADYATDRRFSKKASWSWRRNVDDLTEGYQGVFETRVIAGRPAQVTYSPPGPKLDRSAGIDVWIYNPATATEYQVIGWDGSLRGANVNAVIAIARSLFETPNAP